MIQASPSSVAESDDATSTRKKRRVGATQDNPRVSVSEHQKNLQSYEVGESWWVKITGKIWSSLKLFFLRNLKTRKGSVAKKGQHSEYLITASLRMLGKKFNWSHAFGWLLFRTKRFPSVLAALGQISHGSACSNVSLFHPFIGHDTMWYFSWRFTQPRFCSILAWTYWDLEKLTFFI